MTTWAAVGDETRYESVALDRIVEALDTRYAGRVSHVQVTAAVEAAHRRFRTVPLREFVPVLVEQAARAELDRVLRHR